MRIELPCDLACAASGQHVVADLHHATRPQRVRTGAVIAAGVPLLWSWVLVREVVGDLVVAEVLNGPFGRVSPNPEHPAVGWASTPARFDAEFVAAIEERFWSLGARFHPHDIDTIRLHSATLDPQGCAVLFDVDNIDVAASNAELLERADDSAWWELCRRIVDTATVRHAHGK